jgi:OFA family oxalate/formate antiporter-like MFS transporter
MVVMSQNKAMNRLWVVGGAVGIQLALGALYAWSVFTSPLVEAGWTKLDTMIVFSVCLAVFALVMLWSGKQMEKIGPKKLTLFGGLLFGGGYLFAGLFAGTDFWLITLFIGVMAGAGLGLAYVVPIAVGMRWFPDKKGLITGLAVAGFGFGALLWVKLAGEWLQLIKIYGLSGAFAIYGVVFTMMVVLGSLVMIFPPEGWKPSGWSQSAGAGGVAAAGSVDFESRQMLATPQFYMIFLTLLFGSSAGLMSIGLMKLYPTEALQAAGISMAEAGAIAGTAMAIFFSLANGIGRIGWGIISDKIGRRYAISAMYALQGIAVLSFTFMAGNEYLLYLGAAVIGLTPEGPYPTEVKAPDGSRVLVLQAWQWGHAIGKVHARFTPDGEVAGYRAGITLPVGDRFVQNNAPVPPDSDAYRQILHALEKSGAARIVPEDPETLARLAPYARQVEAFYAAAVATATNDLVRGLNSGPGPLSADAMLAAVPGARAALLNYGGIRRDLLAGTISVGDVLEVMPFGNTLVLVDLTGAELKKALEEGIHYRLQKYPGQNPPTLPYVAGIHLSVQPAAARGKRVSALVVKDEKGMYQPVGPEAVYRVVVNAFVAGGGDGFAAIKKASGFRSDTGIIDSDAFREHLGRLGSVSNPTSPRIIIMPCSP